MLGFIQAADELEVISALAAGTKRLSVEAARFAQMLHEEHGRHLEETLQLGTRLGPVTAKLCKMAIWLRGPGFDLDMKQRLDIELREAA